MNRIPTGDLIIRKLQPRDRGRIKKMVTASGKFNDEEIAVAVELVDEALENGEKSGYVFAVLGEDKRHAFIHGYACYGPAPLTQGVYDLYWIVVDPAAQGRGLGRYLLGHVERDVSRRGGRMILIETSSKETYSATIRFYKRSGYRLEARVRDFYRRGDDKLIFRKELD